MVNDGRQLPPDLEAYCEIWLDDQKRAKTSTRMKAVKGGDPAPYWRDSFEFTDLTAFRVITIYVTQSKGSKNIPYGRTDIPIPSGEEREGWYPVLRVNERTRSNEFVGDLRLKLKCDEQIVLPLESYSEVLEILLNFRENNVISRLAELVTDLERFARNVLRILEGRGLAVLWLNSLIDEEIAEVNPMRVNTLFRGNTLLTKALDAYMRLVGTEYLDDTLGDILRNICKNKISCEVDPSKLEKNDDAAKQWRTLMTHTRACWKAVTDSVNNFPKELLQVFSHLQKRLTEKFSSHQRTTTSTTTTSSSSGVCDSDTDLAGLARYTGVSGFVFLRLICPAILGPKLFFIVGQHPEPKPHRTLTLIAKSLQGLANLVEFGQKEEWMKPMNLFIKENTPSLREFIDRICQPDPYTSGLGSSSNSIRSLPIVPPHSPGSTTSSMFRSQNKNGSIAGGSGNSSNGGGRENLAPLPSPSSLPRCSPRPPFCRDGLHPLGLIESGMLDSNQDIPLLPHLIDLGKELATFSTTVARVIPWMEVYSDDEDDESALATNGNGNGNGNGHNNVNRSGDHKKSIPNDRGPDDGQILVNDRRQEEDILRTLGRACWDLIHMIKDRVELSVELEQQARVRATNGGIHPHQQQQQKRQQQQCQYPQQQQQQNQQSPPSYSSKISCEGSRDGDFQLYSHDHYHGHIDHDDLDHSESYLKGGFDSDDESFGQTSGHEVV
ncbi:hypothetical protein BGZ83_007000 [Gryganskiella cystojenkinii]|nr:hypothetical protein BGZ83_007000 [Gryganskiella cystojenkinii]